MDSAVEIPEAHFTSYQSSVHALLEQELIMCDNPHLTYETLVLRLMKRLLGQLQLSWSHVLESVRQGPCILRPDMHRRLQLIWQQKSRPVTLEEQHCVERVMGHDHNRLGDMTRLAGILNKITDSVSLYAFYAMDGYLGDDPKRYVDNFRYEPEDLQFKHVEAVRRLYDNGLIRNPSEMKTFLETVYRQDEETELAEPGAHYINYIGSWQEVKEIACWRRDQEEKSKRKRSGEEVKSAKVFKTANED